MDANKNFKALLGIRMSTTALHYLYLFSETSKKFTTMFLEWKMSNSSTILLLLPHDVYNTSETVRKWCA